jgi:hypothetical protein
LQEGNPFLPQEKVDQELLPQTTRPWLNSKEWLNSSKLKKLRSKNQKENFQFLIKKLAKSDFFRKIPLFTKY